uniref:Uncharacterized protein n=1 Tax=Anguilla anguilla TaxID=7936 RepID=A0A0E9WHZ7_ANGAN
MVCFHQRDPLATGLGDCSIISTSSQVMLIVKLAPLKQTNKNKYLNSKKGTCYRRTREERVLIRTFRAL